MLKTHFLTFLSYLIRSASHHFYDLWNMRSCDAFWRLFIVFENIFKGKSLDSQIKKRSTYNLFQKQIILNMSQINIYLYVIIRNTNNMFINWVSWTIDTFGHDNNMCQLTWITCFTFEWESLHYICSKWHIMSLLFYLPNNIQVSILWIARIKWHWKLGNIILRSINFLCEDVKVRSSLIYMYKWKTY